MRQGDSTDLEVRQKFALPLVKGRRILDVGCSDGRLLLRLKSQGIEVKGVEIDSTLAVKCAEKGLNVIQGDIEKIDTNSLGVFDSIIMTDVIEHFSDPTAVLRKLQNNLKPDGRIVLTTPNVDWFFWHLYSILGGKPHAWTNPEHKQFYNEKTLDRLLESAGYKAVGKNSIGKIPKTGIHFRSPTALLTCNIVIAAQRR